MDNFKENNQQKLIIVVYIHNIYKNLFARFWCYRVYSCITPAEVQALLNTWDTPDEFVSIPVLFWFVL